MRIAIGGIYTAEMPDFSRPNINNKGGERQITSIPYIRQKVLAIGNEISKIICLPVYPAETDDAYLPCGEEYFASFSGIFSIGRELLHHHERSLQQECRKELSSFLKEYLSGIIEEGCKHVHWAYLPQTELQNGLYETQLRPVIHIGGDLYLRSTTNRGEYRSSGCLITSINERPGLVTRELYSFPRTFLKNSLPVHLSPQDRNNIIDMAKKFSWFHL